MAFREYAQHDGVGLAALVAKKKVSASELVEEAIARVEKHNKALNAVIFPMFDEARRLAKGRQPKGPLAGVPFLLKDILAFYKGVPTRQASRYIPPMPAPHHATLTERFLAAGLIPLGKTNVPEFGMLPTTESKLYGAAHNPWNLAHSTGGSSGGSAASVAAGIVPLAHANDGGGSIRIPASACGLVGLKPTRGRNPLGPDLGDIMGGLVCEGVVSRSVRDTAAALDATHGPDVGDPYAAPPAPRSYLADMKKKPRRLRIAFATKALDGSAMHEDCVAAVKRAASLCEKLGHIVEEASPAIDIAFLTPAFMALWAAGQAALVDSTSLLVGRPPNADELEPLTRAMVDRGRSITASQYLMSVALLQMAGRTVARFHLEYDMWLTPTLGKPPVKLGVIDPMESDVEKAFAPVIDYVPFTAYQNATGQPAINLPLHWNKDRLPIGVQFVGRFGDEATLLRLAAQLEKAAPWSQMRPPVWD